MTKVPSQIQCLTIIGLLAERGGKKGGTSFENGVIIFWFYHEVHVSVFVSTLNKFTSLLLTH